MACAYFTALRFGKGELFKECLTCDGNEKTCNLLGKRLVKKQTGEKQTGENMFVGTREAFELLSEDVQASYDVVVISECSDESGVRGYIGQENKIQIIEEEFQL